MSYLQCEICDMHIADHAAMICAAECGLQICDDCVGYESSGGPVCNRCSRMCPNCGLWDVERTGYPGCVTGCIPCDVEAETKRHKAVEKRVNRRAKLALFAQPKTYKSQHAMKLRSD